jgi:release factor glutamine methyltransferase
MNHLIADNKVATLRAYLTDKLEAGYDSREAGNIVQELFHAYHGWTRSEVVLNATQRLGESELLKYHFALKRLLQGEPLQYVLGYAWFLDMKLRVDNAVLIPRPETEELVRLVAQHISISNPRILDVGTGSGCIALGLKKIIPDAIITGIDVSENALAVARSNASEHMLNIDFRQLDILTEKPEGPFDVIVSNPPYIPIGEHESMAKRVTEHEPHLALFTPDDDVLLFYRRLMHLSEELLAQGGRVYCEIHENTADALLQMAQQHTIQAPAIFTDLQGKKRMMSWSI